MVVSLSCALKIALNIYFDENVKIIQKNPIPPAFEYKNICQRILRVINCGLQGQSKLLPAYRPEIFECPPPYIFRRSENFAASGKGRDFAKNLRRTWTTARRRWRTRLKHKQVAFAKFCCVYMQLLCKCGVFLLNVEYRLQSTG